MNITHHRLRLAAAVVLSVLALILSFGGPLVLEDDGHPLRAAEKISTDAPIAPGVTDGAPDGAFFGRIVAAYVAPAEIVFDRRDLLLGQEAEAAAAADGREAGDYLIREAGHPRLSLPVSDDVVVSRVACGDGGCAEGELQPYGDFTRSFDEQGEVSADRHFDVVVTDGVVVRIDERYFA